jgi:hypothetical protein
VRGEVRANLIVAIARDDDRLAHPRLGQCVELMVEDRAPADGHEAFGHQIGQRQQS